MTTGFKVRPSSSQFLNSRTLHPKLLSDLQGDLLAHAELLGNGDMPTNVVPVDL